MDNLGKYSYFIHWKLKFCTLLTRRFDPTAHNLWQLVAESKSLPTHTTHTTQLRGRRETLLIFDPFTLFFLLLLDQTTQNLRWVSLILSNQSIGSLNLSLLMRISLFFPFLRFSFPLFGFSSTDLSLRYSLFSLPSLPLLFDFCVF